MLRANRITVLRSTFRKQGSQQLYGPGKNPNEAHGRELIHPNSRAILSSWIRTSDSAGPRSDDRYAPLRYEARWVEASYSETKSLQVIKCLRSCSCFNSFAAAAYSTSAQTKGLKNAATGSDQKPHETLCAENQDTDDMPENQEDSQQRRDEMVGFIVDRDVSDVAKELRNAQQEMMVNMRKCSRVLYAVGAVHLTWGGVMFCLLESPLDHAVMTEVCMSSLVILGLAYQLNQTLKPVELFANLEEHRRPRIIFLSRQISRMLGAFFHRGSGIGFVLSLTLTANLLSCLQFIY